MSDAGATELVREICNGLTKFVDNNEESAKPLLGVLLTGFLVPLSEEDFFGTEGWEHGLGCEE